MSLFAELKRRNVFRVGIAYAVAAWIVLQITEVLSELLSLPPEVGPVVVAAVIIGLPIVLFAAWAYELTPEGIKRESEVDRSQSLTPRTGRKLNGVITVLLAVAVAYLLFDKFWLQPRLQAEADATESAPAIEADASSVADGSAEQAPAAAEAPVSPQSVAVLPFENRSPVAGDEFFIDGIHDDLLTTLARVGGLKVISRTSVSRYAGSDKSIPEIARELGVATIMEGAVQRAGNTVRINVQLIDARTDEHLWAQFFDRELTTENLFAIQSEITEKIAGALEAELTPDEESSLESEPTDNLEAYSAYLRGMRGLESRSVDAMREALAAFQHAVELDPDFALAWAGIAKVAEVLPSWWGGMTREEGRAISSAAAERAMELAPDSGDANLALAMTMDEEGSAAQIAQFQKAVELLPNDPMAYQWYANTLQDTPGPGWEKALALLRKAVDLDPLAPNPRSQVARQLLMMGRFEEAEEQLRMVLDSNPDYAPAHGFMSWATGGAGNLDQAAIWSERYIRLDPRSEFPKWALSLTLAQLMDRERLVALRDRWAEQGVYPESTRFASALLAQLDGRYDAALENLRGLPDTPGLDADAERAYILTYKRDYAAALRAWRAAAPGLFEEEGRDQAMAEFAADACVVADVARRVGETGLADTLARKARDYIQQELPRYMENAAFSANLAYCHATLGDHEAALALLETNLRQRRFDFWWEPRLLEMFDPLRGEPRFESLMQAFEDEMARQRASLDRLEAELQQEAGA